MDIPALYSAFIAGRQLPNLGTRTARALLDMARSALLSRGKRLKPSSASDPASIKQELLQAHRELVGGEPVYNSAGPQETRTIEEAEQCLAMLKAINATPRKSSNRITAAATTPKAMPTKPIAATAKTKAPARVPTPPPAKESNDAYLARRVAEQQSAARAVAAAAPKLEPRPLAEVETGELVQLARHEFARPAEKAAAAAELDRRPEVTVFARGSYSVSTRRQPKK